MAINAGDIGRKYGTSIEDFAKANQNTLQDVVMDWSNTGMDLMRKKIRMKARTRGGSALAQSINVVPVSMTGDTIKVSVESDAAYWKFVDQGVRGVKFNKAPKSKFKFKNLGVPAAMVESFKTYIANSGTTSFRNIRTGKRTQLIRKNKKQQNDLITDAAKKMAVATKIGGIAPMNFVNEAVNPKRQRELLLSIKEAMGSCLKVNIKISTIK